MITEHHEKTKTSERDEWDFFRPRFVEVDNLYKRRVTRLKLAPSDYLYVF